MPRYSKRNGSLPVTKPTKLQEKACERLADALLFITEAARLDGKGTFQATDLDEVAARLVKASTALTLMRSWRRPSMRAAERFGRRAGTAELLMLLGGDLKPLSMLLLSDDAFNERLDALDAELGEM